MSETRNEVPMPDDQGVLAGGGELGRRMRERDWSQTPLGPVAGWPQSLKTAVRIMLTSRQPMFVWWGPELINLYNDAYRAIVGGKHPQALGQPARVVWREIWGQVEPRAETALRTNAGTYDEALLLIMERNGYPEETHYTFSYSPIPDDRGEPSGIFCANTDDTGRVIGERQLALLRELAARTAEARTVADVCAMAAAGLASNPHDLPFALIYLLDPEERRATLAGASGIAPDHPAAPASAPLDSETPWPFAEAAAAQGTRLVSDLAAHGELPAGAWDRSAPQVALVPIAPAGATGQAGILVAGLNPYRLFDDAYRGFLELVAGQIAAGIANAQAYEEERRRAEALAELDRAKTVFFSNISHEFRTPLTLMLGPIEELLQRPGSAIAPEDRAQIELIYRNALRLLKLVNSLLDFSRIEAGRLRATYEPTDLAAFTAELASLFRSAVERAGLRLVVSCPPLGEPVYVDRELWEKIVFNLLSNAFKFTFEGEIEVRVGVRGRLAELTVRDTGTGIPPEELPHLFERFHRVSGARGRSIEGTGIGLALVQELARLHGGAVHVTSAPDQGSSFSVTLPLGVEHLPPERVGAGADPATPGLAGEGFVEEALRWLPAAEDAPPPGLEQQGADPAPAAVASEQPRPDPQQPKPRVLLADDNADMREYVRRLLAADYAVEAAADGAAALAAARAAPPDLVLSDVMMPRLDGFGLIHALRADPRTAEVPVILLSARAGEEARVEGLQAGADDYLVKPFSARELQARVAARLELVRARLEAARALREREEALRANEERLASLYAQEQAAREQAELASRLKDDFLATISHELRTPLTSILGYSHLLQARRRDEAYVGRTLEKIVRSAQAQAQLIDDLLDVSRIVAGKLRLEPRPLDLSGVIRAAIDAVRPALDAKQIALVTALDERVGPIVGDPDRLQQVVWNLLSNAAKFTPSQGTVQVRLEAADDHAQISVSDTGRGIHPEFLPFIFDQFRQAESASNRSFGGLGLGLSIVRHLVEMHGGTVRAESAGEEQGATFTVSIPLNAQPTPDSDEPCPGEADGMAPALDGLRVLVVDDQAELLELLQDMLASAGAEVQTSAGAREGLAALRAWRPDVLLSDIAMPGEDGFWLIGNVRALPPDEGGAVPAAALTAYVRVEDRLRVLASGFQQYISKPVEPAELLHIVAQLAQAGALDGE